ncbi:MAG: hypothetical protein PCFJNLEI_01201 [Verrucomicrobiae bacterium]|nr:hypothetical protein [Verrucomicrobiae bacterium]
MKTWITLTVAASVLALATGCATSRPTAQQAVVCPGCKSVLVRPEGGLEAFSFALAGGEHRCPGCQGALATWLKEGTLQHKCSLCQDAPYSCAAHGW